MAVKSLMLNGELKCSECKQAIVTYTGYWIVNPADALADVREQLEGHVCENITAPSEHTSYSLEQPKND